MTDKRSESERVSARAPLPSIAPPTDDIDAEWGADDDIPAPARLPQLDARVQSAATLAPGEASRASTPALASAPAPAAPVATPLPAPRLATPLPAPRLPTPVPAAPRPASSAPPVARTSSPAAAPSPASALATPATTNPLRKQTLLGIAPVLPSLTQPPTATEPPSPAAAPSTPPAAASALPVVAAASSTPRAGNPLRQQTLFGIAPVLPSHAPATAAPAAETAAATTTEQPAPADDEPAAPLPSSPPAGIVSSSPFSRDVSAESVAAPPTPAFAASSTEHELRALRPRRSRWLLPLAAAALIALGVVGLRRLESSSLPASLPPPTPAAPQPAALVAREPEAIAPTPAPSAKAAADDGDESAEPQPSSPDAEPLAKPAEPAAKPAEPATGDVRKVRVESSPRGARLFWRGKEVGTTPFTLELQPGEKHSYELGLPGYVTRKVVIDGSKSEISIGMKPEPAAPTGTKPRK